LGSWLYINCVPVIISTFLIIEQYIISIRELGAENITQKPVNFNDVVEAADRGSAHIGWFESSLLIQII
jgi:hypothetical protein